MLYPRKARKRWSLLIWFVCTILGVVSLTSQVQADLPPRPTKTPTPEEQKPTPEPPAGTLILSTQPAKDGLWSVVQWQDPKGNWHDVEGWRGTVANGKTIWWVEQDNWGNELFRWVVLQEQGGETLGISQSFVLPGSGKTLIVKVELLK
jgi:hypothetical protein